MDIFSMLTSGTKLDKKKFKKDVDIFKSKSDANALVKGQALLEQTNLEIPNNLDFFGDKKEESKNKTKLESESNFEQDQVEVKPISSHQEAKTYREEHKIKVYGQDIPFPLQSFQDLIQNFSIPVGVVENLKSLPYKEMTPIQKQAAPIIIKGRDLIACAPTGTGKTMAFAIPLLCKLKHPARKDGYRSLILSPTRELARQIEEQLLTLVEGTKFNVELLSNEEESSLKLPKGKNPRVDVLITTPLRLVYAIKEKKINLSSVTQIILDEADKLFDFGFIEQIDEIINACTAKDRRIALFSATITGGVEALASTILHDTCRVVIGNKNGATELISQSLLYCKLESGKRFALRNLLEGGQLDVPCLIFVQSTDRAKQLYGELAVNNRKNLLIDVIHAARPQDQREQVISKFLTGQVWILICTDVMARGVDFKGVKLVINYDLPQTVQSYVHRIGRTGRAGRPGKAITLFTDPDRVYLKSIVNVMQSAGCPVKDWMLKLSKPGQQAKFDLKRKPIERDDILSSSDKLVKKQSKEDVKASKPYKEKSASKPNPSKKDKSKAKPKAVRKP